MAGHEFPACLCVIDAHPYRLITLVRSITSVSPIFRSNSFANSLRISKESNCEYPGPCRLSKASPKVSASTGHPSHLDPRYPASPSISSLSLSQNLTCIHPNVSSTLWQSETELKCICQVSSGATTRLVRMPGHIPMIPGSPSSLPSLCIKSWSSQSKAHD